MRCPGFAEDHSWRSQFSKGVKTQIGVGVSSRISGQIYEGLFQLSFLISTRETESSTMYCQGPQLACLSPPTGLGALRYGRLQAPACLRKRGPVTDRWLCELEPAKGFDAARAQRAAGGWAGGGCRVGATGGQVGGAGRRVGEPGPGPLRESRAAFEPRGVGAAQRPSHAGMAG